MSVLVVIISRTLMLSFIIQIKHCLKLRACTMNVHYCEKYLLELTLPNITKIMLDLCCLKASLSCRFET